MQNTDWMLYSSCVMAVLLCYFLRYCQERHKVPKPDAIFQFICSITVSYLTFFLYPSLHNTTIFDMHMFTSEQLTLGLSSYLGAYFVKQADYIFKKGWKIWVGDIAKKVLAYTEDKKL